MKVVDINGVREGDMTNDMSPADQAIGVVAATLMLGTARRIGVTYDGTPLSIELAEEVLLAACHGLTESAIKEEADPQGEVACAVSEALMQLEQIVRNPQAVASLLEQREGRHGRVPA